MRAFGFLGALVMIGTAALSSACASTGFVPRPFPTPGGAPASAPCDPGTRCGEAGAASAPCDPGTRCGEAGAASAPCDPGTRCGGAANAGAADMYAVTGTALSLRGSPYRNGGSDPAGFDCSGFTQYVFGQHGLALPRDVRDQFKVGSSVKAAELVPGDLLFFTTVSPGASHVGIALGGDEFIHAPSSSGVVRVERLSGPYWSQRFVGARRITRL